MQMRRKDRERDAAFGLKLFEECEYATLATVSEDGTPYCIPISVVLDGEYIYMHGAKEGHKVQNFLHNENVCLNCVGKTKLLPDKFSTEYESAVVFGKIEIVEDEQEKIRALMKICEKYAPSNIENAQKMVSASLNNVGIYKIKISKITAKAH